MALSDNKVKIQALLAGINALPEAGSGEAPDPVLQEKAVTPTKAAQSVTPDMGYDGLSKVNVGAIPDEYIVPSGTVSITENGTHNVREAENVNVNVPAPEIMLQEKTATPTEEAQTITPDAEYDGLSKVTVNAMPTATQAMPSISVSSGGLITASATQTAGYVTAGTKSATEQMTTQGAQTITPGTSDKTISSGRYLTGTQTIKGDANLVAANIKSGVSIFGVTGTHEGGEDISAETAEYTSQLNELETVIDGLPDAGSGGGGSVETCTVTIIDNVTMDGMLGTRAIVAATFAEVVDGVAIPKTWLLKNHRHEGNATIISVPQNSMITFGDDGGLCGFASASAIVDGDAVIITEDNVEQENFCYLQFAAVFVKGSCTITLNFQD